MNDQDIDLEHLAPPWDDEELVGDDEHEAIDRMVKAFKQAVDAGATKAARLAVIAVANYSLIAQKKWPKLLERANELMAEIDNKQSRRWGITKPKKPKKDNK
jgi:hypothetical protein